MRRALRAALLALCLLLLALPHPLPSRPRPRARAAPPRLAPPPPPQPPPPPPLGAFFLVSAREVASDLALDHFLRVYPRGQVLLAASDLGAPAAAGVLRAISRRHGVAVAYDGKAHAAGADDAGADADAAAAAAAAAAATAAAAPIAGVFESEHGIAAFRDAAAALAWLARLLDAVSEGFAPEVTHVLLLEDDVLVARPTDTRALMNDISGANEWGPVLPAAAIAHVRASGAGAGGSGGGGGGGGGGRRFVFGGFGGCILRRAFFAAMWRARASVERDVAAYAALDHGGIMTADNVLSFLVYLRNGTVGSWPGFCETWWPTYEARVRAGDFEVLHKFKALYPA